MWYFAGNVFFALIMTYFTTEIYGGISSKAFYALLIFSGWFVVGWLFSFFYSKTFFYKLPLVFELFLYYLKEVWLASLVVAHDIITPKHFMKPAILAVPLDVQSNLEITLFTIFLTMTPGSLPLDISKDKKYLYVHGLYIKRNDPEAKKRELKNGFERRILKITR